MPNKNIVHAPIPAQRFADLILDIGTCLLSSGAHSGRINSNLSRIADTWNFEININPTFKGLLVTVRDRNDNENTVTTFREAPPHNVHLSMLTDVSKLSWQVVDGKLNIEEVEEEFAVIKKKPSYKNWMIAIAVGFSCAGLCVFAGGDIYNAITAMLAASIGFFVKIKVAGLNYNSMISIGIAAFVSTLISGFGSLYNIGAEPQAAMATGVLYLIPGVPLINSIIDLIDGYLSSAINRALYAGFTLLCIAAGMTLCITFMGINNFN